MDRCRGFGVAGVFVVGVVGLVAVVVGMMRVFAVVVVVVVDFATRTLVGLERCGGGVARERGSETRRMSRKRRWWWCLWRETGRGARLTVP